MPRTMVPWDVAGPPWFNDFRREMNRLMRDFLGGEDGGEQSAWFTPRANVAETDSGYEVTLDLPGMKPEDFDIELKDRHLWITGERKCECEEKGKTYHRIERQSGRFRRVIPLSESVEAEKVSADYKDGVLHIKVPKSEAVRPKRIEVKT
jgi:HSP20 family protein